MTVIAMCFITIRKCIFFYFTVYVSFCYYNGYMNLGQEYKTNLYSHKSYKPNGYIVPMEFRVHFFTRICAFSGRTKMHLNGMFLIGTESLFSSLQSLGKIDIFQLFATRE